MNLALLLAVAGVVSFQMSLNRRMGSPVVVSVGLVGQLLRLTRPIPSDQMRHRAGPFGLIVRPIAAAVAQAAVLSWG